VGRLRDWFEGRGLEDVLDDPRVERPQGSPYTGERDLANGPAADRESMARTPTAPGWYLVDGTLRYHDGEGWTEHFAPPYPTSLTTTRIASAVFMGVLGALFIVWLGAQIEPDHVYFPVKFVVQELPEALR
jgi:hypothetical protein